MLEIEDVIKWLTEISLRPCDFSTDDFDSYETEHLANEALEICEDAKVFCKQRNDAIELLKEKQAEIERLIKEKHIKTFEEAENGRTAQIADQAVCRIQTQDGIHQASAQVEVTDELAADRNYRFLCYGFGNRSSKKRRTEDGEAQFLGSTAYRWIPCMGAVFCRILGIREQKGGE